ncbi:adenine DNA glycosylase [Abditibacteriota bacterium]|nr:adenine DNA glycosylase [Abditibacteriota bacterium]
MLQQTTVAAVGPFYERFLNRFPDSKSLAEADEADVLAQWAGLGYYARARNLHKAAKAIQNEHSGTFPRELDAILSLPGVGRYTAGAVSSIAFSTRAPIVDANVARVLSRVLLVGGDLKTSKNQATLWEAATQIVLVESVEPREVNPAMMELGALICTPKSPRCPLCPVADECEARKQGRQNELPFIPPKKAPTPMFDVCALALDKMGRVLLRKRPDHADIWWQGMWELPRTTRSENESSQEALIRLGQELGCQFAPQTRATTVKHGVTRYTIELECWRVEASHVTENESLKWVDAEEADGLAMPSIMSRLFERFVPNSASSEQLSLL